MRTASAQSDQGLPCPPTVQFDTTECINREQRPRLHFVHAQGDQKLRILHMFEGDCRRSFFKTQAWLFY